MLRQVSAKAVHDGRARFREILCAVNASNPGEYVDRRSCEHILHRFQDEAPGKGTGVDLGPIAGGLRIFIVPGIFGECVAHVVRPFEDGWARIRGLGVAVEFLPVSGRSGSAHNAAQIAEHLKSVEVRPGQKVVLLAYSKGASDAMEALVSFASVASKVDALVSVAGVINGTPVADRLAPLYQSVLSALPVAECAPGDGLGVASLRRSERLGWLARAKLPERVRYYSISGFDDDDRISTPLRPFWKMLEHVDPRNDGQVIFFDAVIPGGTLLGYVKADHWAISLPFSTSSNALGAAFVDRNAFPRGVLLESMVRFVAEDLARQ